MPHPVYTYILNILGLVGFYDISTIVGYLMPNPLYTKYIGFGLVWVGLGFMAHKSGATPLRVRVDIRMMVM